MISGDITRLLQAWRDGDDRAFDDLYNHVASRVRAIARRNRVQFPTSEYQTTELVHEAYSALLGRASPPKLADSRHFFRFLAKVMRDLLIDELRRAKSQRRDHQGLLPLRDDIIASNTLDMDALLHLREALATLEAESSVLATVLDLKYFLGLTTEQSAEVLQLSTATVNRKLKLAKARLGLLLEQKAPSHPASGE